VEDVTAQLVEQMRSGMKHQGLSGAELARHIERLTGNRRSLMWVSRRLHGQVPILDRDTIALILILEIDVLALAGPRPKRKRRQSTDSASKEKGTS
jgi:hypothetical protein